MFNKSLAFGLLAAGLMIAPGAAFANSQSQNSNQNTVQNGTAINGSVNGQSSESLNIQEQIQNRRDSIGRGRPYGRPGYCAPSYSGQSQNSSQGTNQSGAAVDYSDNAQSSSSVNDQKQVSNNTKACR
ncbi:hypothetical protein IQ247_05635 [Plectonema cf. radiosum LEGE 06105]|uniref:Uncharacterized protein n=1 Tax=Plectonema cf. radiosum LEGE 06105 TaxID=945769 RepID=A0A8J7EY20_9CYAN|nr:hypothetical protein [Plectonema radiosum]MBE9212196.1 hypothetical protein [Plectonema cf. radiosum LEGE 06105]